MISIDPIQRRRRFTLLAQARVSGRSALPILLLLLLVGLAGLGAGWLLRGSSEDRRAPSLDDRRAALAAPGARPVEPLASQRTPFPVMSAPLDEMADAANPDPRGHAEGTESFQNARLPQRGARGSDMAMEAAGNRHLVAEEPQARFERLQLLTRNQDAETRLATAREILAEGTAGSPLSGRALEVLAELDPGAVVGELNRLIADEPEDPRNRGVAGSWIRSLAHRPEALSNEDLHSLYANGSPGVRLAAAQSMADRGDPSLSALFVEERAKDLSSEDSEVRSQALRDLAEARNPNSLALVRPLLSDERVEVRLQALVAMRQLGGPAVIEDLRPLLQDSSEPVRDAAQRMIEMMERRLSLERDRAAQR